jgi:hypothetical protein
MKRSVLLLVVALWPSYCSAAQQVSSGMAEPKKALNIAVIADKTGGLDKSPLVSLLEVQLSNNKNIKLIERTKIDKILQEQQLSAAGLLERNNTIKIGQLLRADAFIILSLENQTEKVGDLIRVRLAQTAHGLRLLDYFEQIEASKPDEVAQKIIKRIESVLVKLSLPAGAAVPVGVVDIHRVQLGDKYRILERSLPKLLSVRLGIEPKIIMLEREDLKILQDEKLRTSGEDSKFWGSGVLIEGNLQPKDGSLIISFNLRRPGGEGTKNIIIPVDPNEPSVAVDKAAKEIVQEILNAPPTGQWQLSAEAEQFYQQGQLLVNHSRHEEALPLFETSHALQPENVYYTGAIFERIWDIRRENEKVVRKNKDIRDAIAKTKKSNTIANLIKNLAEPPVCQYTDLEISEMVSILLRQIRKENESSTITNPTMDIYNKISRKLGTEIFMASEGYFISHISVATEQIRQINRQNRKIWVEILNEKVEKRLVNHQTTIESAATAVSRLSWLSSDDPNELISNIKKAFTEFVMPLELGGKIYSPQVRMLVFYQAFQVQLMVHSTAALDNTFLKGHGKEFLEFWRNYLKELTDVNDPIIKLNSCLALANGGSGADIEEYRKEVPIYTNKAFEIIKDIITNPNLSSEDNTIHLLLTRWKDFTYMGESSINEIVQFWEEICKILIEKNDYESLAVLDPGWRPFSGRRYSVDTIGRYYNLLKRITITLESHQSDSKVVKAISNIKDFQAELKSQYPQLDVTKTTSNLHVNMLITQKDWFQNIPNSGGRLIQRGPNGDIPWSERSFKIKLQDKFLWIVFQAGGSTSNRNSQGKFEWPSGIGLVGINLAQKKVFALWQTKVISPNSIKEITGLSVTDKSSYISLLKVGILELPGSQQEGRKYFENPKVSTLSSLPSLLITSIAQEGDKLWVAYGDTEQESGLGIYDPKTEKWENVYCSSLKDKPPFSAGQPYQINSMYIEPNRLLFSVSGIEQSGLWKLDTNTRQLKYIWPIYGDLSNGVGDNVWLKSRSYYVKIDPSSEKMTLLVRNALSKLKMYPDKSPLEGLTEDMFLPESFLDKVKLSFYYSQGNLDLSTGTIHNSKLWARLGTSQIIIAEKGKSFEEADIIDNNILDGKPVEKFVSTPYGLIAIGEGTVGLIETEGTQK